MTLLIIHAAATFVMVGLIWTMQLVHYPLFALVGESGFTDYEAAHQRRILRLLAIPAITEIMSAGLIALDPPAGVSPALALAGGLLLAAVWVLTGVVQAPLHGRLSGGYDEGLIAGLVRSNWWRTLAWTGRGAIAALMIGAAS